MLKILLVEDELIIAEDMTNMLERIGYEIIGSAMDFDEAIEILETEKPDLILLDVNLGGKKDGIHLAEEINKRFEIPFIFTTSHTDGVTIERAKKTQPINYLVKPFKQAQLYTAIEIAMLNLAKKEDTSKAETSEETENNLVIKDALFIKDKYSYVKLPLSEILWMKAENNYVEIHTTQKKELIRANLGHFLEKINKKNFFRTHKSYAVNLDHMTRFDPTSVYILNIEVPLSKNYADELMKMIPTM
jgi:DNA-binding LytR/AlgR family response regulator